MNNDFVASPTVFPVEFEQLLETISHLQEGVNKKNSPYLRFAVFGYNEPKLFLPF
jgi:hypothetical protein